MSNADVIIEILETEGVEYLLVFRTIVCSIQRRRMTSGRSLRAPNESLSIWRMRIPG